MILRTVEAYLNRKDALMNSLYTAAEEKRLTAAAIAEARHLRAVAPAQFWSALGRLTRGLVHPGRPGAATRPQAK